MAVTGSVTTWDGAADRVRHAASFPTHYLREHMPPMAIRMLRLGEETGQLPVLAGQVADSMKRNCSAARPASSVSSGRSPHRHKCSRRGLIVSA